MDQRTLRKQHKALWEIWVRHKFKFGENPVPQKYKNYIMAVVNDSRRCLVILEYNDGWISDRDEKDRQVDVNISSKEILSYQDQEISENSFFSLLMDLIKIFSTEFLNNELIVCTRTNGPGQVIFDMIRKEVLNFNQMDNVRLFPTSRRSKFGKELFKNPGKGWEMSVGEEKDCMDAMRTAQEQRYFTLCTDKSKQAFQATSVDDKERQGDVNPFEYCWLMLSFIRLSTMNLFTE